MTPHMISKMEIHIIDFMGENFPDVPVYMSGEDVPADSSTYSRFWVISSDDAFSVGFGRGAKSRSVGVLQFDVYGPKGEGSGPTGAIAHAVAKSMHRISYIIPEESGYLTTRDAVSKDMKDQGEEQRYLARVPYQYDYLL